MNLKNCDTHGVFMASRCPRCFDGFNDAPKTAVKAFSSPNLPPQSLKTVQDSGKATPKPRGHKTMNGTERRFAERLELQRIAGEIKGSVYEGITLKWGTDTTGKGMRYTADFCIFENDGKITLAETKNAFIWGKDKTRYQGCKAQWESHFKFIMWQWKDKQWTQIG